MAPMCVSFAQSICTKWFEPSISPGPVLPSWVSGRDGGVEDLARQALGELKRLGGREGGEGTHN